MKNFSADYRAALRGKHTRYFGCAFFIGENEYHLSNTDTEFTYNGDTYAPSYVKSISNIEITSQPKINEITVKIDVSDTIFSALILTEVWVNKVFKVLKVIEGSAGVIVGGEVVYSGLIVDFALDEESRELHLKVASIWKDFEKSAGIRSNTASQSIHYPNDTALDHAPAATQETYWGKKSPSSSSSSIPSSGGPKFEAPTNSE